MTAYDPNAWHDLFVAVASAAAALSGLLFVAVSINLDRILPSPLLPARAADSLAMLVTLLVISLLMLAPEQPPVLLGAELIAIGFLLLVRVARSPAYRHRPPDTPLHWVAVPAAVAVFSCLPIVIGGASQTVGIGGGLYWLLPGLVIGFAGAVYNAWILLIEILR